MRFLIVGAGATGGYFGGRLLEIGREVTFLVRPGRAARLAETGLVIESPRGAYTHSAPPTVGADDVARQAPFDVIVLSCKAYDLEDAMAAFAPAVGPRTSILPLLNGMRHLDVLDRRFGPDRVLGGWCQIAATLDDDGRILHLNDSHALSFGERAGPRSERVDAIAGAMRGARFEARASNAILQEMWEKWVFLASLAASTCLMRGTIGDIVAAGAGWVPQALLEGCRSIAEGAGYPPTKENLDRAKAILATPGSPLTASMLRDVQRGARTEADHVLADLASRAKGEAPLLLRAAYAHLRSYEARRARESQPS